MSGRAARWSAVGGYLVAVGVLALAATRADRYASVAFALPALAPAILGPPLGAALLGRSWWLLLLVPVPAALGLALAVRVDGVYPFAYGWISTVLALVVLPPAVAVARRVDDRRLPVVGLLLLAASPLVVPLAFLDSRRSVTVERPRPVSVDARAGTYRGAGLGDSVAEVRRRLGDGERLTADDPRQRDVGPSGLVTGPTGLRSRPELRYGRSLSFLLDGTARVEFVAIADRRAQTAEGVGPGDSLSRFREAYPGLRCGEGDAGLESAEPYPACRVRLAKRRWLYVGGTYERSGRPAAVLYLSRRPLGF